MAPKPTTATATTQRHAITSLAICGIEADIGKEKADTFRPFQHPDLRAATWRVFCTAQNNSSPTRPSTTPSGSVKTTTCAGKVNAEAFIIRRPALVQRQSALGKYFQLNARRK